jgi:hypothetical protein
LIHTIKCQSEKRSKDRGKRRGRRRRRERKEAYAGKVSEEGSSLFTVDLGEAFEEIMFDSRWIVGRT